VCAVSAVGGIEESVERGLALCTTCRACVESCPISIETPDVVEEIRARATAGGIMPIEEHAPMVSAVRNYGNPWAQREGPGEVGEGPWHTGRRRGPADTAFFAGCSLAYASPRVARAAVGVLRAAGVEPVYLGAGESCCGSPLLRIGQVDLFREVAGVNVERLSPRACGGW